MVENAPPNIITEDNLTATQDKEYNVDYSSDDDGQGIITWHLDTNATWLDINASTGLLSGKPGSDDIGVYRVNVSVDDGNGGWDWSDFILNVGNVNDPPLILTDDVVTAYEDQEYRVEYNASDLDVLDNTFEWAVETDGDWLNISKDDGVLKGIPRNKDVGFQLVNISVRDPHGGEDSHEFLLEIVNAPPIILTTNVVEALEDQTYSVDYSSDDDGDDPVPQTTWNIESDASWLTMDPTTGNLTGTPTNDEVGIYWVNVSVQDGNGGNNWTNFSMGVINTNDPPEITTIPITEATSGERYSYNVDAIDIDVGDILRYSLDIAPVGMVIHPGTGLIDWTPTNDYVSDKKAVVIINVSDNSSSTQQNFSITVHPFLAVHVKNPKEGQKVNGILKVTGTAQGPENVKIELKVDGENWKEAQGHKNWTYRIDTNDLGNGEHTLVVRATWGNYSSEETTVSFIVENKSLSTTLASSWCLWLILILIISMVLFIILRKVKVNVGDKDNSFHHDKDNEGEGDPERNEGLWNSEE